MRVPEITGEGIRRELLAIIKMVAYIKKDVVLSSGQKSDFYIDCKQVSLRGDGAHAIGHLFFEVMKKREQDVGDTFDACGGMALGALPISMTLTQHAFSQGRALPSVCIRKQEKFHGTCATIEGRQNVAANAKIVVVEDVVTTGNATINAAIALREAGFVVDFAIAIVDRQGGGEDNLRKCGIELCSLFNLSDF